MKITSEYHTDNNAVKTQNSNIEHALHFSIQSTYKGGGRRLRDAKTKTTNTEPQLQAKVQSIYKGAILFRTLINVLSKMWLYKPIIFLFQSCPRVSTLGWPNRSGGGLQSRCIWVQFPSPAPQYAYNTLANSSTA
jgi:hypothetical protein